MALGLFKKLMWFGVLSTTLMTGFFAALEWWIHHSTEAHIHSQVGQLPSNQVGLVLGTSKYTSSGHLNPYFSHRIEAAANLYHQGKINRILVSGDNGHRSYNEPAAMHKALVKLGVNRP